MGIQIYPSELQIKANSSDIKGPVPIFHLTISDGFISSKIYDERYDFDFDVVNFPFWDGDIPHAQSYSVNISQLIQFARVSSHVADLNNNNNNNNNNIFISKGKHIWHECQSNIWSSITKVEMTLAIEHA